MKNYLHLSLLATALCFTQCTKEEAVPAKPGTTAKPAINYDQESIKLMNQLTPQMVGDWSLQRVHIKRQSYNSSQSEAGIKRDTVLQELAILSIRQAAVPRTNPKDLRHPDFDCTIQYKGKSYPMHFWLLASAEHVFDKTGPQAFFLLEYNFPSGTRFPEAEETYLKSIGLVDNFSVETTADPNTMTWRGLNRGIDKIELRRQ
ncbi:hypothetical protein H8B15_07080 [Hymenobacter sp. BT507]|uniref:DUF5004 domain-containing protein n=1 Tax=Hymenobacter citatus TaxID=2763506 RepID=A0ABR7MIJ7_9BACT|nr:hypothetical protein [Hymenobacter citatus]MBC6610679.1 hypothetical protein [Hymenobacter citatus]